MTARLVAEVWQLEHTKQKMVTHTSDVCIGQWCSIHDPSDHSMRGFPQLWRTDRMIMERTCAHGIGHPDPDHMAHLKRTLPPRDYEAEGVHGCDGCCQ